jgi:hypothetical protein
VDVSNRSFGLFNNLDAEGSNGTVYRTNNTNSALGDGAFGELIGDLNKSAIRFDNIRIKSGDITLSPPPPSPTYYTLTVSSAGGGTVSGGGIFDAGTQGTALATPRSGYSFSNWGGDYNGCYSTNPALSVTMDENKTCTAYFLW